LFSPRHLGAILFLASMYGFWNLWAGFNGFFTPYLVKEHNLPEWVATIVPASYFLIGMVSILAIFMTLSDKVNQRLLFGISAALHVIGMAILAIFGFTLEIYILHVVIMGVAGGFGAQSFFQLWSAELFPTAIRSTAQGLTFAIVRISLGIWSFFVPWLASYDYATLAWILTGFLVASGVIGLIWAPRNEGKSLEEIAAARA
jgi:inositol transporter-like SP family MFS transporter